ncbi:DUF4178 domain-containing protein [Pleionea mediterranea]|uniref:Uncharacterized protein DUF4178 n=1 Tax=Pleionea mediterranea TaxID=523701 RepID=A0A316F915_9GAMM|nr:DUF4178 domain-containing protein [Pleionea mediterranea]PWK42181.1 uncharacterized protein DUF4178 [Pleionea mediterranea]
MLDIKQRLQEVRGLTLFNPMDKSALKVQSINSHSYLDINNETYKVTGVSRYLDVKWNNFKKRNNDYWVTELQLVHLVSGKSTFIEWEYDDELEIGETLAEVKLRDIQFDGKPLTRAALEYIADEEMGSVTCQGKTYHYVEDDTWAALYYRSNDATPLPVRMYEFASDDDQFLTVEAWEEDDDKPSREAFISRSVKETSVVVLQLGQKH